MMRYLAQYPLAEDVVPFPPRGRATSPRPKSLRHCLAHELHNVDQPRCPAYVHFWYQLQKPRVPSYAGLEAELLSARNDSLALHGGLHESSWLLITSRWDRRELYHGWISNTSVSSLISFIWNVLTGWQPLSGVARSKNTDST